MNSAPKLGNTGEICGPPLNKVKTGTKIIDGIIMLSNSDRVKGKYFDVQPILVALHYICVWTICISKPRKIGFVLMYHSAASKCGTNIHI